MALSSAQVLAYLDAHSIRRHDGDFESLLEMLHYIYTISNPIDNEAIRNGFRNFETILNNLSPDEKDQLFCTAVDLCLEHERAAFSHGILVGMLLMTELNGLP